MGDMTDRSIFSLPHLGCLPRRPPHDAVVLAARDVLLLLSSFYLRADSYACESFGELIR